MKCAGARIIAQDEASCVVLGMPREAMPMGVVDRVSPVARIARDLMEPLRVASSRLTATGAAQT